VVLQPRASGEPKSRGNAALTRFLSLGLVYYRPRFVAAQALPGMIKAHVESNAGPVRTINEDSWLLDPDLGLFAVADGMGGHNAGEVASRLALEALSGFIRRSETDSDLSWPYGVDPELTFLANRLRTAIHLANRRVFRAAESHDDYTGMGTTVVGLLVAGRTAVIGSVGDSRIYRLRASGDFAPITQDDSWAAALRAQGMGPAELSQHPMRHVLTNVIGARDEVNVHVAELPLDCGDCFLLCSDGLYEPLGEHGLREVLAGPSDPAAQAQTLVQRALAAGTRDNVTALVVRHEEAG
jgi:PPM family protein phosphatase